MTVTLTRAAAGHTDTVTIVPAPSNPDCECAVTWRHDGAETLFCLVWECEAAVIRADCLADGYTTTLEGSHQC